MPGSPIGSGVRLRPETILSVVLLALVLGASLTGLLDWLEVKTLDARFRSRPLPESDERIVVLGISDQCLEQLGRWPWPRRMHARMLDTLRTAGARAVIFDFLFQEASTDDPALGPGTVSGDQALVAACASFGAVFLPLNLVPVRIVDPDTLEAKTEIDVDRPFPKLASVARGLGMVNVDYRNLNPDGIVRRLPLRIKRGGQSFPALSLVAARSLTGETVEGDDEQMVFGGRPLPLETLQRMEWGEGGLALTSHPAYLVNYAGDAVCGAIPTFLFSDVSSGRIDPELFRDRIVLIGPTAVGLADIKLTPFGEMPGVMIHANLLRNFLRRDFLQAPSIAVRIAVFLGLGLVTWGFLVACGPWVGAGASLALILVYGGFTFWGFRQFGWVLELVGPALFVTLQFAAGRFLQMVDSLRVAYRSLERRTGELEDANRRLDRQVTDLSTLNEVAGRLAAILSMNTLTREIIRIYLNLWDAEAALLVMIEGEEQPFRPVDSEGYSGEDARLMLFDMHVARGLAKVREERRPFSDPDGRWFSCFLPLMVGNRLWGILLLKERNPYSEFLSQREAFCLTLLGVTATALENARLYDLATVDTLTRLYVRRYFTIQMDQEFKRAKRYGHSLALLMTDIDSFKKFNDTFGHQQGDLVLREVAAVVKRSLRDIDIPVRYGGEEFAIVLPETSLEGALVVAERIRRNVETHLVPRENGADDPLRVTISIGLASLPDHSADTPEQLVKLADDALYQAKGQGRNRVCYAVRQR